MKGNTGRDENKRKVRKRKKRLEYIHKDGRGSYRGERGRTWRQNYNNKKVKSKASLVGTGRKDTEG